VSPTNRVRFPSIDLLKAAGIVTVVWIHAFTSFSPDMPAGVERIAFLTRFAVPAFFFAAGFLQASGPRLNPRAFVSRRLVRIFVPYVIASLCAMAFRWWIGESHWTPTRAAIDLVMGGAWGIYYFIPVLIGAAAAGEAVFRFPRLAWPIFGLFWILGLLNETRVIWSGDLWLEMRSPIRWWGYFFAGWVAAVQLESLRCLPDARRARIAGAALQLGGLMFAIYLFLLPPSWSPTSAAVQYIMIYGVIVGVFLLVWNSPEQPAIRWLSEASYPIYLYHYFLIAMVGQRPEDPVRDAVAFVFACVGSVVFVVMERKLLGRSARLLLG
jgi:peptidoglycan/LPS O-acetylase OafA/YrhL